MIRNHGPGGRVSLDVGAETGFLRFTVADTGIGMDAAGVEKALQPFGQVDDVMSRRHEGTGLGLPLTKGLVEAHHGTLSLESQPGAGTRVTLRLPEG